MSTNSGRPRPRKPPSTAKSGGGLSRNDRLTLEFSNLSELQRAPPAPPGAPVSATTLFDQSLARWLILGGGVVAIAGVLVYSFVASPPTRPSANTLADLARQRQRLLLLLARLDETFEQGELDEVVYRQARARYKAELIRMMEVL